MDFHQYLRVLRRHLLLICFSIVVCTASAAVLAWTRPPAYAAQTQLFVSTSGATNVPTDLSQTYQGALFSQQQVLSYAQLVSGPTVVEAVAQQLRLSESVAHLESEIRTSVPTGTVLINVTVTDPLPQRARAIANVVGVQAAKFIVKLETPPGRKSSGVTMEVTRQAGEPTAPVSPHKPLYLVLGALLGVVLGIVITVVREGLDTRVRGDDEVSAITGAPVIGSIAEHRDADRRPLIAVADPSSMQAEEYRRLRTNLSVLQLAPERRAFVVSSAVESEGKSHTVANLGIVVAQAGFSVVLVDANLRRPKLGELFGLSSGAGLTDVLLGDVPLSTALHVWNESLPLKVLCAGRSAANPSELLGSEPFTAMLDALMGRADVVILDAPALLPFTDAAVLARLVSGVILVTRDASTSAEDLATATRSVRAVDETVRGVVLNRVRDRRAISGRHAPTRVQADRTAGSRGVATEKPVHVSARG
jgi:capsular exopolysaccharide synthesis family protein